MPEFMSEDIHEQPHKAEIIGDTHQKKRKKKPVHRNEENGGTPQGNSDQQSSIAVIFFNSKYVLPLNHDVLCPQ